MADSAPSSPAPSRPGRPSATSTMWAMVLGWVLLRLVAGSSGPSGASGASARRGTSGAKDDRGFGGKQNAPANAKHEGARGRQADAPTDIPALGWKDILWRVYEEFGKDRIISVAAGVTYYALLAIFPAIAALVSIYGLFADPATIQEHLNALSGRDAGRRSRHRSRTGHADQSQGSGTLGFSFVIGLVISLWSANAGMKAVFDALNIVYDEEEKRSFFWLNVQSLAFTLGAIAFVLIALAGIVVLPIVLDYVGLGSSIEMALVPGPLAGPPDCGRRRSRHPLPLWSEPRQSELEMGDAGRHRCRSALACRVDAVLLVRVEFRQLQRDLRLARRRDRLHDVDLDFVDRGSDWAPRSTPRVEHQTAKDTTEGPRKPMGARGAQMADTLGPAKA